MNYAKTILAVTLLPGIGRSTAFLMIKKYGKTIEDSEIAILKQLKELKVEHKRIPVPNLDTIIEKLIEAEDILKKSEDLGIEVVTQLDEGFPQSLKNIPNPPVILYVKGNIEAINEKKAVAIIGTRNVSEHGMKVAMRLGEIFAKKGITVVSGLALGCDTYGHIGCLNENGKTIAILATGIDLISPKSNTELAKKIIEKGGALLSEYPIGTKSFKGYYIERDRLQSGLSQAVIIVETDIVGGTMHTVEFAVKQKKLIACYKHPAKYSSIPQSKGNRMLINENRALPINNIESINSLLGKIEKKNSLDEFLIEGLNQMKISDLW